MVRGLPKGTSVATCPVRVLEQWVTAAKITTGPIFGADLPPGQPLRHGWQEGIEWARRPAHRGGVADAGWDRREGLQRA
jgi:hypothetical protein